MKFSRIFQYCVCTIAIFFHCDFAVADLTTLLPAKPKSSSHADEPVKLSSINDYIRAAKKISLPATVSAELGPNSSALAYLVEPPQEDNPLWSISYKLSATAAAVSLKLVTVEFDEHQRVVGFDTLLERSGLGAVVIEELLWPLKPVYVLLSANPPSPATLSITSLSKNWALLDAKGAYGDEIALISNEPITKKTDISWQTSMGDEQQPLWDLKLVSEPGTQYGLQMRSGNQSANGMGAKSQSLTIRNLLSPPSELRLSIKPKGKHFSRVALLLKQQPSTVTNHERELAPPQTLSYGKFFSGVISHLSGTGVQKPETDTWIINVPKNKEEAELQPTQIQVVADNAYNDVKFSLNIAGRSTPLTQKSATGEVNSGPLQLQPGQYKLNISSGSLGTAYKVKVEWAEQQSANSEKEPNNTVQDANRIVSRKVVKGELTGTTDMDFFLLDTTSDGAAQYWRLITTGGGVKRIQLGSKYWIDAHKADNSPTLSMDYMLLLPGVHEIKLTGDGSYSLRAIPLGPPKPGFEIEPNDGKLGPSGRLILGEIAKGSLDKAIITGHSDIDRYRFAIKQGGKYRITVVAPQDEAIRTSLSINGSDWFSSNQTTPAGSTLRYASQLLAGEYVIELTNLKGRRALDEYSVLIEKLPSNADVNDEPNDIVSFATPILNTDTKIASLGLLDQTDCYNFAPSSEKSTVELKSNEKLKVQFLDRYSRSRQVLSKRDPVNKTLWSLEPHTDPVFVCISGAGHITNTKPYTLSVNLGASIIQPKAQLATNDLPNMMRGGLNVAWYGLGARWEATRKDIPEKTSDARIKKLNRVINNVSPYGSGAEWDAFKNNADDYQLNLAGDEAIPLVGVVLNTRTNSHARRKTRNFRLMVSQDGVSFTQAMLGELSFSNDDQYLLFEKPVKAKYIKFLPLDSFQSRSPHYARFQELKLIASADYSNLQNEIDLANSSIGGHLIGHDFKPAVKHNANALDAAIIDPQPNDASTKQHLCQFPKEQSTAGWVVGFHHNRAARVAQIDYTSDTTDSTVPQFDSLKVSVSSRSPLGPWLNVANWNSEQLGTPQTIPMLNSPWVRFIKFVATGQEQMSYRCPQDIKVREADVSNSYRSILGEWSEYGESGPYEVAQKIILNDYAPQGGSSAAQASTIQQNQVVKSSVKRERNDDWFGYQSSGPNTQSNSLVISIAHPTSFKPSVNISSASGESVQTMVEPSSLTDESTKLESDPSFDILPHGWTTTNYTAWTSGNSDYVIHIQEPPRNVVLTWDASGSMGPQLPYIEMATRRWANYLKPDHEFAKVMKFAQKSHPENEWANLPHMLQAALHSISSKRSYSSDAENSLLDANQLLAPRYGNHAIVVTTDGEFPRSTAFWDYQEQHCSTIYAAGLAAAATGEDFKLQSLYQDNFQNWVSACGGQYKYCDSVSCLEDFYEFAANDIRKAKPYHLKISEAYRAPPKPGLLKVVAGVKTTKATAKALYVILDASGSMLKTLDGKLRIDIAKNTLKKVIRESVGEQNHFGMRTFGLKVGECHHELTLPIAKHSANKIDAAIDGVKVVNLAKTPIAASLAAAASDLSSYPGEKVIVLLTDGEETCGGNSEAILTSLSANDIDVKMHIVGFALDDVALVNQFKQWAMIGGGQYHEAGNQSALQTALRNAVTPRYEVKNSVGDIVYTGYLDDPQHPLPSGNYKVALPDYPELEPIKVELSPNKETLAEFK